MGHFAVKFTMEAIERGVEMAQEGDVPGGDAFGVAWRDGRYARKARRHFWKKRPPQFKGKVKKVKEIKDKDEKRHGLADGGEIKREDSGS